MLVKLSQAHRYKGGTMKHATYPALNKHRYQPGDIIDVDAEYFEKYLEPYKFAEPCNLGVNAKDATGALLGKLPMGQLRTLAENVGIDLDALNGTGPNGRVTETDLVNALAEIGQAKAKEATDDEAERRKQLGGYKLKKLGKIAQEAGIYDVIKGTAGGGNLLKQDLVDAIMAWEQAGPAEDGADENGEDNQQEE